MHKVLVSGDLFTELENQVGDDSEACYLNSDDMKELTSETASNLIIKSTVDVGECRFCLKLFIANDNAFRKSQANRLQKY